ncbi:MAG: GEVED domain-containing protein [Cyanobacteria bacterium P01_F01_bin.143]
MDVDVTNTTGEDALLTGWIDFDQSGTFDADEEASVLVSTSGSETLTWDSLPGLVSGTTYSRFRLSTNFTTTTESTTTPVTTTVYSENFDSSPTGWDVDPNGTDGADSAGEGQWEIGSPSSETRGGVNVQLAPFSGSSSLVTGAGTNQDVDNGVTTVRSPNFSLSADTVSYDVSFQYYLGVVDNSGADPGDNGFIARIVRESDDTVIETFVTDQPNANQTATWTAFSQSYDFSGFEGETVYLEFLSDDGTTTGDVIEASVDDIDITFTEDVTVNVDVPDPLASTGFLDDGEVEDYKINIAVDYGDAPDTSSGIGTGDYQTTAENDGASHIIDTDIRLGTNIDADDGTLQNTDATADDIDNTDDEDGVTFTSNLEIDNSSYSVDVDVNLNFPSSTISVSDDFSSDYTGGSGWLAGWTETGETTDENNGNIDIQSGILHIQDDTASISRQFDFSSATGDATLSFNYSQNSLDNANEGYDIIIDDGIGGSPTTVFTIDDSTTDSTAAGEFASVSIPQSFLTSTTTITIQSRGIVNQGTGDDAYIDNIDISAPTGSGTTATLVGWIDFDQSGTFDSDEAASTTVTSSGTETLTWNSLPGITAGTTYSRFRLSTDSNLDSDYATGQLSDGEVEDYKLTVGIDYGDARDTGVGTATGDYSTTANDNGPSHIIDSNLSIGANVDADDGTLQNTGATADDDALNDGSTDDEDGITFGSTLRTDSTSYSVTVDINNDTGNDAEIIGWIDFDQSGTFDSDEATTATFGADAIGQTLTWSSIPADITDGDTYVRFRLSTDDTLDVNYSTGQLSDGEVEDYQINIVGIDYGDAPDVTVGETNPSPGEYATTLADGGASHTITDGLKLGLTVDAENGTLQNTAATADDLDNNNDDDDEDGVTFNSTLDVSTTSYSVTVDYTNSTGGDAIIIGWIDFDQSGTFDADEAVSSGTLTTDELDLSTTLTWNSFPGIVGGTTYARFRLNDNITNLTTSTATGELDGGEVEDYLIFVGGGTDYGDAPDSYGTLIASSGASHDIVDGLNIGSIIDAESDGQDSVGADGDNNNDTDDEDGVTFTSNLETTDTSYSVDVDVNNTTGADVTLAGWIDFDGSGTFESDESTSVTVSSSGTQTLTWSSLPGITAGTTYARFRLGNNETSIFSENFDSSPTGWTVNPDGTDTATLDEDGQWIIDDPVAHDRFGDASNDQLEANSSPNALVTGSGDTNTDVDITSGTPDGVTTVDSPDFTLPSVFDSLNLSLEYYLSVSQANDDNFTIELRQTSDNALLSTLLNETPTATQTGSWTTFNASLDSFGGSTVYLRFIATDVSNDSVIEVGVDDISVVSTSSTLDPTGAITNGEVEDYQITITATDYGDAPDTGTGTGTGNYQTTANDDGAAHTIISGLSLGSTAPDADNGTLQNNAATADNNDSTDDEDGVDFTAVSNLRVVDSSYSIDVDVTNTTGNDAVVVGWIDFDQSGTFDSDEAVSASANSSDPVNLTWSTIPTDILPGTTYARFRISNDTTTLTTSYSTGLLSSGEVEDYAITIDAADYGDAPDTASGTTTGDYSTTASDGGAAHGIDRNLFLGSNIDADDGTQQNDDADADDQTTLGQLNYEYFDLTSDVDSVDDIPESGADVVGTLDPDLDLVANADQGDTDDFGIRYTGFINITTAGTYTFYTTSDDGSTLSIEDTLVVNNDGEHASATQSGDFTFSAPGYYPIQVEFFEATGSQSLTLQYEGPGITSPINIPGSVLAVEVDDENGVTFTSTDIQTSDTSYSVDVSVFNNTGGDAEVIGWIDFDRSGTFDSDEAVIRTISTNTSSETVTLTWDNNGNGFTSEDISEGITYARFRLSSDTTTLTTSYSTGNLTDGEVEDYQINIIGVDYGDAPDDGVSGNSAGDYQTLADNGGASHIIIDDLYLGGSVDADDGTLEDRDAVADDNDNIDDEDGVTFNNILSNGNNGGNDYTVDLVVTNETGGDAKLVGWIDLDQDGNFEASEAVTQTVPHAIGGQNTTLTWSGLSGVLGGTTYARFRVTTDSTLDLGSLQDTDSVGQFDSGEVEDYQLAVQGGIDYGDAPDTGSSTGTGNYQTLSSDSGASHTIVSDLFIGDTVDEDDGTLQDSSAIADDNDLNNDEDGVNFLATLEEGDTDYSVTVDLTNDTGSNATIVGWIDFNQDGAFDANEAATATVSSSSSEQTATLTWSDIGTSTPTLLEGETYARFRLSTDSALDTIENSDSTGLLSDGEVEDYHICVVSSGMGGTDGADSITADAGGSVIAGYKGQDTLTGGAGVDHFCYSETSDGVDIINGFTVGSGGDQIMLTQILRDEVGYTGTDPISDGYVVLVDYGATGTMVQIDFDGSGSLLPKDLALVVDTGNADINETTLGANNLVF